MFMYIYIFPASSNSKTAFAKSQMPHREGQNIKKDVNVS